MGSTSVETAVMAHTNPACLTYTQFIAPTMEEHTTRSLIRLSSSTQRTANYSLHVNEYISISRGYECFFFLGWRFGPQMLQTAYFLSKQLPFIKCLFWKKKETKDKVKVKQIREFVFLEQICFVWNLWHCFHRSKLLYPTGYDVFSKDILIQGRKISSIYMLICI